MYAPNPPSQLGISSDEPLSRLPTGRRVYVFNPDRWTPTAAGRAVEEVMSGGDSRQG
jgi:hypothetical protein